MLNGGSSSWKSAVFDRVAASAPVSDALRAPHAAVTLNWQGNDDAATLESHAAEGDQMRPVHVTREAAVAAILGRLRELGIDPAALHAVGHRIVHGGPRFRQSVRLDETVVRALRELEPLAPSHNPVELAGIAAAGSALPHAAQVAAFDTAFHRTLPPHAFTYAGPYDWLAQDVRKYGFHGINVAYCVERAADLLGREAARLRLVVAHLGGGCSVTAVRDGASVDTTMGFTPLDGIAMATRSGSVDPGILVYLLRRANRTGSSVAEAASDLDDTLNHASGIRGLSGISGDVRPVLAAEARGDERARLALEVFVHRLAGAIAGMLPALGRLDALVFTGGIGEHGAALRERTCATLGALGVELDAGANEARRENDADVATPSSPARVLVIGAREEWAIARECARVLG